MTFVWTPWAALGLVSGAMGWTLAWTIYAARPECLQNRFLALALVVSGMNVTAWSALLPLSGDAATAYGVARLQMALYLAVLPAYLLFLSTLDSPLVRPIANAPARWAIAVGGLALVVFHLATPAFVSGVLDISLTPNFQITDPIYRFMPTDGLAGAGGPRDRFNEASVVFFAFAALVAWTVYRRAPTPTLRRTAKAFFVAFAARDIIVAVALGVVSPSISGVDYRTSTFIHAFNALAFPLEEIVFYILLGYGILRAQLFDVEVKVKWTVRNGTIAAAFVSVFFVASEGAQSLLSERIGPVAGLLAAGTLVFALAPLQRAAERISIAAVPGADGSAEYLAFRKLEVYRGALDEMLLDGDLSARDRSVLAGLSQRLGISGDVAAALERDARDARAARAGVA